MATNMIKSNGFIKIFTGSARSFMNTLKTVAYPVQLSSYYVMTAILVTCHSMGMDFSFGLIDNTPSSMYYHSFIWYAVTCVLYSLIIWLSSIILIRYTFKLLLQYKGWMYEEKGCGGKVSLPTKIWGITMKALTGISKPTLYGYQGCLPCLPVPSINDTITKYLHSARAYMDDKRYSEMEEKAKHFQREISGRLQKFLYLKSWFKPNYVTDWWEKYAYLINHKPIAVNCNYYAFNTIHVKTTNMQAARAAGTTYYLLQFRNLIDSNKLQPLLVQKVIPRCNWQYERLFNTTRIPGIEADTIKHNNYSKHIVVIHKGRYFKLPLYEGGVMLTKNQMERQYEMILDDSSLPEPGEKHLGSLTADDRTTWGKLRNTLLFNEQWKISLKTIENSAFVVVLEDIDFDFDSMNREDLSEYARILLHGSGYDRWYDKSFNIIVSRNGQIGCNIEHSWGDGTVASHLLEWVLAEEMFHGYADDGHTTGYPCKVEPPRPVRLKWEFDQVFLQSITKSFENSQILINNVDHQFYAYRGCGRRFMKKCSVSADSFIQMVLQCTYYRDTGCFCPTYESAVTVLYLHGRTETIRSCTMESCEFVKAMENQTTTNDEKISLFRRACKIHQQSFLDAMCGKGFDRHLFALYIASKYLNTDSPFLEEAISEPWLLSTSQAPMGITGKINWRTHPTAMPLGGGFGAQAHDGYGISYGYSNEDGIFFHISSYKNSKRTDSLHFIQLLEKSFEDMKNIFVSCSLENNNDTTKITNGLKTSTKY